MSKANPVKAMRAVLPAPIDVGGGYRVRPLSLGMYAILERIGSPLITPGATPDVLETIPSLFVLTHDPAEALGGDLFERALAWADQVPPAIIVDIRDAAVRQIRAMTDVVPEAGKKKAATTAGSSRASTSPARPTAGATRTRSGACPHPPSPSCGDRTGSRTATSATSR